MKTGIIWRLGLAVAAATLFVQCTQADKTPVESNDTFGPIATRAAIPANFSFVANQIKASVWVQPPINGHLDESYGDSTRWVNLMQNLKASGGAFSLFAAEIGYLHSDSGFLPLLRQEGIPLSVELPGMTQCLIAHLIAGAELNGDDVQGQNIFQTVFQIVNPTDRPDPSGRGWFWTNDLVEVIPDEILFDERQPNILPEFNPEILATTPGTWAERKAAAKINNYCYTYGMDWDTALATLRQDYINYLDVAKAKWGVNMPDVGIHWNVNPGWEWRDEKGLDTINALDSTYFDTPANFWAIVQTHPQFNSVEYCNQLVDALTAAGHKPTRILLDVDWTYDIGYSLRALLMHKTGLAARGVQMGINLVEGSLPDNEELYFDGQTLRRRVGTDAPNILYENTIVAIMEYLKASTVYEPGMHIRAGSWRFRPYEIGAQVNENTLGSLPNAVNRVYDLL